MKAVTVGHMDLLRALLCDHSADLTEADVADMIADLWSIGLFSHSEIRAIEDAWSADPSILVSLLTGDIDEIAAKRLEWAVPSVVAPTRRLQVAG